ncbi:MAG: hypothetical protein KGL26_06105 [Pseudomonadota bacterium]|nr:hypothetical protein [Pseudomonadota bacterium]
MAFPRPFGRKGQTRRQPQRPASLAPAVVSRAECPPQIELAPAPQPLAAAAIDEELQAWKQARKRPIPWGPLSLMASLSFGIASFELPDSVNGIVNLLLYALSAMSLWVWFSKRREKRRAKAQEARPQ